MDWSLVLAAVGLGFVGLAVLAAMRQESPDTRRVLHASLAAIGFAAAVVSMRILPDGAVRASMATISLAMALYFTAHEVVSSIAALRHRA